MDYVLLCKNFFGATNIPIFLLKNGQVEYSAMMETLPVTSQAAWRIYPTDHNPGFCGYSPDLEYGRVQIENTDYDLIIGPAFSVPVTNQLVRQFMHELTIPLSARELLTEFLFCTCVSIIKKLIFMILIILTSVMPTAQTIILLMI